MHVFVTGATGWLGSVIVPELVSHGHTVLGLARSESSVRKLESMNAQVLKGSLEDLDVLRRGARQCDAVIHAAFVHDWANYAACCAKDKAAIEAMGEVLKGTGKTLIVTSGSMLVNKPEGDDGVAHESDPAAEALPRTASDLAALALIDHDVKVTIVRLPPSVHGKGDHGFLSFLADIATTKGHTAYVGDGGNRWPAVHRKDAAVLYRLALENPLHPILHAIGDEQVPFKRIAEALGRVLGLETRSVSPDEAGAYFGWLVMFCSRDAPTSAEFTKREMGWEPKEVGLIEDVEKNYEF